jgi:predicted ATPase/DNA-binding winged helix-turn-helix (wHTH) protein
LVPTENLLKRDGATVKLSRRAFSILVALVERAGQVVTKNELMKLVWPDASVDEGSLRFHVVALRRALGDREGGARYISTVSGRGYCFVAQTRPSGSELAGAKQNISGYFPHLPFSSTQVVGRDRIINEVSTQLLDDRFITILGAGGIGKTTVALSVGHVLFERFDGAVHFLDLGPLGDPSLISGALASALGLMVQSSDPMPEVVAFLRQHRALIILDSCEHWIEPVAELAEMIYLGTEHTFLLATSREALRVEGERIFQLPPLDSPPDYGTITAKEALGFPAVQLFVERVVASGTTFRLNDADAPIVAEICRKLDGMALAIELAAGRVRTYGLQETARLLDGRLKFLWQGRRTALPRHQTLQATFDWSYELLGDVERVVLSRLSVFAGVFTLEAARAVVAIGDITESHVIDALAGLAEKSLVTAKPSNAVIHYRLLDTTRDYAIAKLDERLEKGALARRHAEYFCALMDRLNASRANMTRREAINLFNDHLGNIRAAFGWCFREGGDLGLGVSLVAASTRPLFQLSLITECRDWTERAINALDETTVGTKEEMHLQLSLAQVLMCTRGNSEEVRRAFSRSIELAEVHQRFDYQLQILATLHLFLVFTADFSESLECARQSETIAMRSRDPSTAAASNSLLGISHHLLGDQKKAYDHLSIALLDSNNRALLDLQWFDPLFRATYFLAPCLWIKGLADQAVTAALRAIEKAEHPVASCGALFRGICVFLWRGDLAKAEDHLATYITHAERYSFGALSNLGRGIAGVIAVRKGDIRMGVAILEENLNALHQSRYDVMRPELVCALAEGLARTSGFQAALATMNDEINRVDLMGGSCMMPELLRVKSDLLSSAPGGDLVAAEQLLLRSLSLAQSQSALSWQLRSAISLTRLYLRLGRKPTAHDRLAETHRLLTEGFDSTDVRTATELLSELRR